MTEDKIIRKLRKQLESAVAKQKDEMAIELLGKLSEADPTSPRWPHKRGELFRKLNQRREAIDCYSAAAELYLSQGFLARGVAMAKAIVDIDPERIDVLERIDPEAARKLHRQERPKGISARPKAAPAAKAGAARAAPAQRAAAVPAKQPQAPRGRAAAAPAEPPQPPRARHAAVLAEDPHAQPMRHPAVLAEDPHAQPMRHPAVLAEDPHAQQRRPQAQAQAPKATPPAQARADQTPPAAARKAHATGSGAERRPGGAQPARAQPPDIDPGGFRLPLPPRLPELTDRVLELGDELLVAPDAMAHETRFSDAPPARSVNLELTQAELTPRKAAPKHASLPPKPPSARRLAQLPLFPLFAEIPLQAMVSLVDGSEILDLEDGAIVVRRGDPADALYGIIQGGVEVIVASRGRQITTMLGEGDVFGESCLLAGEKRNANIVVRGEVTLMKVPRATFNKVIGTHPRVAEVLLELLTRRLLTNLLQTSPLFHEFDARSRQELAKTFEIRRATRDMVLAEIGKVMDGLYISLTGELEVQYADGRAPERFLAGTLFGQASLLTRRPSDVGIRAMSTMLVLRLPARAFQSAAMQYPGLLDRVSELASTSVAMIDS